MQRAYGEGPQLQKSWDDWPFRNRVVVCVSEAPERFETPSGRPGTTTIHARCTCQSPSGCVTGHRERGDTPGHNNTHQNRANMAGRGTTRPVRGTTPCRDTTHQARGTTPDHVTTHQTCGTTRGRVTMDLARVTMPGWGDTVQPAVSQIHRRPKARWCVQAHQDSARLH